MQRQPHRAQRQRRQAGQYTLSQREAAGGHRPVRGALHARIGPAFQRLVQGARSRRDQADAEQRVQQAALHAGDAGLHRAQVKTAPAGDQHQADDFDLEQLAKVVQERGRSAGAGRMNVRLAQTRAVICELCRNCGLGSGSHLDERKPHWLHGRRLRPAACPDDSKRRSSRLFDWGASSSLQRLSSYRSAKGFSIRIPEAGPSLVANPKSPVDPLRPVCHSPRLNSHPQYIPSGASGGQCRQRVRMRGSTVRANVSNSATPTLLQGKSGSPFLRRVC